MSEQIFNIAMIIDNRIESILEVGPEFASLFLANPTFIEVTNSAPIGWVYKDGEFVNPNSL